mmetsp:Transcript_58134/g.139509  ORF Transcript_58134/g.139509 Transcript_58134/m.139509 type:complete len:107 (+) Transcript_58134:104-424(+)
MQALIDVLKPMLFVSKVPMVNGTIFSVAVIFGAIVSFSAMLSSSDPSPSSTLRPRTAWRCTFASRTRRSAIPLIDLPHEAFSVASVLHHEHRAVGIVLRNGLVMGL